MVSIFWDRQGVIILDYLEVGLTTNGAYYAEEQRRVRQKIVKKTKGTLTRGVLLLQDNVPSHTSQVAMAVATKCRFEVLHHPPSDFYLFPKLKTNLRGWKQ